MNLNDPITETAALELSLLRPPSYGEQVGDQPLRRLRLISLGYVVGHGPQLAPGEPAAERDSFSEVSLVARLRKAIRRLNTSPPQCTRSTLLLNLLSGEVQQLLSR